MANRFPGRRWEGDGFGVKAPWRRDGRRLTAVGSVGLRGRLMYAASCVRYDRIAGTSTIPHRDRRRRIMAKFHHADLPVTSATNP